MTEDHALLRLDLDLGSPAVREAALIAIDGPRHEIGADEFCAAHGLAPVVLDAWRVEMREADRG